MKACMGKVLRVDFGSRSIEEEKIPKKIYDKIIGGIGLGAWYLYRNIPAGPDPLGPYNILGFLSGLLTGTGSVITSRGMAVCKPPLQAAGGRRELRGQPLPHHQTEQLRRDFYEWSIGRASPPPDRQPWFKSY